uniref:Uncharacterized protein n=1 Tax=Cacopsylla melanoneura TaxID=428564 RepID=A0A8D8THB1_9HEMI
MPPPMEKPPMTMLLIGVPALTKLSMNTFSTSACSLIDDFISGRLMWIPCRSCHTRDFCPYMAVYSLTGAEGNRNRICLAPIVISIWSRNRDKYCRISNPFPPDPCRKITVPVCFLLTYFTTLTAPFLCRCSPKNSSNF